jgi:phospholipase C
MKSRLTFWLTLLSALSTLPLASCVSAGGGSQTQPQTYQLTVTAPATGAGTVTSSPVGINCPTTCSASFDQNTQITLTATAGSNYFFGGWSGGCSGTSTCNLTLTAAASVSATFNPGDGLTVAMAGTGTGTITSSPAGINCPTTCSASFPQKTQVTLSETPVTGSTFAGWSGACTGMATCSVTVAAAESVTATFNSASPSYAVTVIEAGTGTGTVTSSPAGINCPTTCSASFTQNTQVTLSETPAANSVFAGWSGACTGTASCSVTVTATASVTASFSPGNPYAALNHIILFAQENRSLDHYFGAMLGYWSANGYGTKGQTFNGLAQFNPPVNGVTPAPPTNPGCDPTVTDGICTPNPSYPVSSFHFESECQEEQSPFWNEAHNNWDYTNQADQPAENPPPLNGFVYTAAYDAEYQVPPLMDVNGVRAMGYFDWTDLNYYYFMASNFGTSDTWFSPLMNRTQLNRMYLLAATSAGHAYPLAAPDGPLVNKTIFEALQNAGITWKIYVNSEAVINPITGAACNNEISDANAECLIESSYINMFTYEQTIINSAGQTPDLLQNIVPVTQFAVDAANGTLPQFALIEPASAASLDEHPNDLDTSTPADVQAGASYAAGLINDLMASPNWADSAMIFTFDEAGGLYDHVPPQPATPPGDFLSPIDLNAALNDICTKPGQELGQGTCDFAWTGYRVPMIVISPYSVKNFVSHNVRDTTAVLKMVETRFGLPSLTARDASQMDMTEFFDFVNKPWATAPTPPTQVTDGECSLVPPASWNDPPALVVTISGATGSGSVAGNPGNITTCEPGGEGCFGSFAYGTDVTLTATPNSGYNFAGWSGADCSGTATCSITVTANTSVTATFTTSGPAPARISGVTRP